MLCRARKDQTNPTAVRAAAAIQQRRYRACRQK